MLNEAAAPTPFAKAALPDPANVDTAVLEIAMARTALLFVSATYTVVLLAATENG